MLLDVQVFINRSDRRIMNNAVWYQLNIQFKREKFESDDLL